jgi:hypothetical protein
LQLPCGAAAREVWPSRQNGSGGSAQAFGAPLQAPAAVQASEVEQTSPSSQAAPACLRPYEHTPLEQLPVDTWQIDGGVAHSTPVQGSPTHRPVSVSQPKAQSAGASTYEQVPALHVPTGTCESEVCADEQVGGGGVLHTTVAPAQAPEAVQRSGVVQGSPSSHWAFSGLSA